MFSDQPDIMTPSQAAKALGIGRNTLYNLLKNGEILYFNVGKNIKIPKSALLYFIDTACYNNRVGVDIAPTERSVYNGGN